MKPEVFIVTTTKAGRSRKFIWDSTAAVEVDMPKGWTLEKVKNSIHVRLDKQVIPVSAAAVEKGSTVTLPTSGKGKDISIRVQPISQIRAAYLNDPVYKKDPVREMALFASFGVGKFLVDYQPFHDAYVGYVRKKPVFTYVRSSNGGQIKALLDEMKIKFKGKAAEDLELAKPMMVSDDQLLDAMIMRGNHWWRIHQVAMPKALTPEQIKVAEFDPEANSFKRLLKGIGIFLLLLLFLILIIPKPEEEKKEEPPKPESVKIKLKQAKFQKAMPRGEPEQEVGIRADGDVQDKKELSAPKSDDKEKLEAARKSAEKDKQLKSERAEKEKELRETRERAAQEKAAERERAAQERAVDRAKQREEQARVNQEKAAERQRLKEERQKAAQEAAAEREKVAQERAAEKARQRAEAAERAAQEKAARANAAAQAELNKFRGAFGGLAGKKASGDPGGGSAGAESGIYAGGGAGTQGGGSAGALGAGTLNVGPGRLGGGGSKVAKFGGGSGTGDGSPRGSGSSGVSYGSGDKGIANGKGGAFVPVDPGGIKADTGLTKNEIGEVIYRKRSEVRYCYEAALIRKTGLEGKVVVQFTIMASGMVKSAAVEDSTVNDEILEQCIINHLKRWKFPKTRGGVEVGVSYPFVFKILGKE